MVRCSAHDDSQASLSGDEGCDGPILFKCFAGCSTKAIVEAVGLTLADIALVL
jgi:hypothetical protein